MLIGAFGRHTSTWRSNQETVAQEKRLVRLFDRRGLFTAGVRQRRQSDRLIGELLTEQSQYAAVNLVETEFVDSEER